MAMQIQGNYDHSGADYAERVKEKQAAERAEKAKEAEKAAEEKNSGRLVPRASRMSSRVEMLGEVRSRSTWDRNPLVSSLRLASSSRVSPMACLRCRRRFPISISTPFRCAAAVGIRQPRR